MSQHSTLPRMGIDRRARGWLPGIPFLLLALWCLLGGLDGLVQHHQETSPRPYRLASACALLLFAAVQLHTLQPHLMRATVAKSRPVWSDLYRNRMFWKRLFLGTAIGYLLILALGPDTHLRYAFRALVAGWYTLVLWNTLGCPAIRNSVVAGPSRMTAHGWRRLQYSLHWSNLERLAFGVFLAIAATEAVLRVADGWNQTSTPAAYVARRLRLPPGQELHGQRINQLGYWDQEFEPATPARFRIAVLGDGVLLSGGKEGNPFNRLEQRHPNVDIYNFGLPHAGPREYAAQLAAEVAQLRPGLVLAFLSLGDDITQPLPLPDKYDWQSLRLVQWSNRLLSIAPPPRPDLTHGFTTAAPVQTDYDGWLAAHAPRLEVCLTPIPPTLERRWQETFAQLDRLTAACRNGQLPLAIVLVPDQFQVSDLACDALRRRMGYSREQLDLQLPQRRLAVYAARHDLPLLDLLPAFRAADTSTFAQHGTDWSEAGQQITTETLNDWLQTQFAGVLSPDTTRLAER